MIRSDTTRRAAFAVYDALGEMFVRVSAQLAGGGTEFVRVVMAGAAQS